jgi:tetraacyldisaccharide 4'-kinase
MITGIRNYLFDCGILKSYTFNVPIIAVGNLSVGGMVKHLEYLIRLLSENFSVATLSRGIRESLKGIGCFFKCRNTWRRTVSVFTKFKTSSGR